MKKEGGKGGKGRERAGKTFGSDKKEEEVVEKERAREFVGPNEKSVQSGNVFKPPSSSAANEPMNGTLSSSSSFIRERRTKKRKRRKSGEISHFFPGIGKKRCENLLFAPPPPFSLRPFSSFLSEERPSTHSPFRRFQFVSSRPALPPPLLPGQTPIDDDVSWP